MKFNKNENILRFYTGLQLHIAYCLILILLYVLFVNTFSFNYPIQHVPFNKTIWLQEGEKGQGIPKKRYSMVNDIIENQLHQSMDKEEVISILGFSDENHDWDKARTVFVYYLGQYESIIGIAFLHIHFDEQNQLIDTQIKRD